MTSRGVKMVAKRCIEHKVKASAEFADLESNFEDRSKLTPEDPYVGISPYSEADVFFFFGRKKSIREILLSLKTQPLTILYGESGVGKSSILRAGIVNAIYQQDKENEIYEIPKEVAVVFPPLDYISGEHDYKKYLWGDKLLDNLLHQIKEKIQEIYPTISLSEPDTFKEKISNTHSNSKSLQSRVQQSRKKSWFVSVLEDWTNKLGDDRDSGYIYIVLDQFEDYFLYHDPENIKNEFIEEIARAVKATDLSVNFLMSIRSDEHYKLKQLKRWFLDIYACEVELKHLDQDSAEEAIVRPIDRYNCRKVVINNINNKRLVVLAGEAGIGKSFMLHEGIIRYLDRQREARASLQNSKEPLFSVLLFNNWTKNPLQDLVEQIKAEIKLCPNQDETTHDSIARLQTLDEILKFWKSYLEREYGRLLIILDQFELYFSQSPANEKFAISRILTNPDLPVHFLISIRDTKDSLNHLSNLISNWNLTDSVWSGQCLYLNKDDSVEVYWLKDRTKPLPIEKTDQPLLFKGTVQIDKEIKVCELDNCKKYNHNQNQKQVQDEGLNLVDRILNQLPDSNQPETQEETQITAPYLQFVMTQLWEEREHRKNLCFITHTEFEKLGEVDGIIEKYIDTRLGKLFSEKDRKDRKIAEHVLSYFTTPSGGKNRLSKNDLVKYALEKAKNFNLPLRLEEGKVNVILKKLCDARILRSVSSSSPTSYEIYISQLSKAIQQIHEEYVSYVYNLMLAQKLPIQSLSQQRLRNDELAALLAFRAYKLNEKHNLDMLDEVDEALRIALSVDDFGFTLKGHLGGVTSVAFSSDGKLLASGGHDSRIRLWSLTSEKNYPYPFFVAHDQTVSALAFAPKESKTLVSASKDGTVKIWDLDKDNLENLPRRILFSYSDDEVTSIVFSQDGRFLVSGSKKGIIKLLDLHKVPNLQQDSLSWKNCTNSYPEFLMDHWNINDYWNVNQEKQRAEKPIEVRCLAFSLSNKLASGYSNGTVCLWDLSQDDFDKKQQIYDSHTGEQIRSIAFNKDGTSLAVSLGGQVPKIQIWDLNTNPILKLFRMNIVKPLLNKALSFSKLINNFSIHKAFNILRQQNPIVIYPIILENLGEDEDLDTVNSVAFYFEKNILVAGGEDQKVRIWDLSKPEKKPKTLPGRYFGISSVAFSSKGNWVAAGSWDYAVRLWEWDRRPSKVKPMILPGKEDAKSTHEKNVMFVAVSKDGNMIASASWDRTVGLWERNQSNKGNQLNEEFRLCNFLEGHDERVWSVAFSQDGKLLASSGVNNNKLVTKQNIATFEIEDNKVKLWNIEHRNSEMIRSIGFPEQFRFSFKNAPMRFWLLLLNMNCLAGTLFLHNFKVAKDGFSSVAFSPNSEILATGLWDDSYQKQYTLLLWDISNIDDINWQNGRLPKEKPIFFRHHADLDKDYEWSVTTVIFHPTNNQILATAGNDGIVRLWYLDKLNWDKQEAEVKSISLEKHAKKETVRSLAFSPDGNILSSGSHDKTIRLWNVSDLDWEGKQQPKSILIKDCHSENSHSYWVGSVSFSKDSDGNLQLASAGYEGTIKLWNLGKQSELNWKTKEKEQEAILKLNPISLRDHEQSATSVAFIPNNPNNSNSPYQLVSGSYDNTVRLWITSTDKLAKMVKEKVLRKLTPAERERFEIPERDEQQTSDN